MSVQGALARIAESPEGAQAIVDADESVSAELFKSRVAVVRTWTAEMKLPTKDVFLKLVLNSNLCAQHVSFLRRVKFPALECDADYPAVMTRMMSP